VINKTEWESAGFVLAKTAGFQSAPIILSWQDCGNEMKKSNDLYANCYLVKPSDIEEFNATVRSIEEFWLTRAKLPTS